MRKKVGHDNNLHKVCIILEIALLFESFNFLTIWSNFKARFWPTEFVVQTDTGRIPSVSKKIQKFFEIFNTENLWE